MMPLNWKVEGLISSKFKFRGVRTAKVNENMYFHARKQNLVEHRTVSEMEWIWDITEVT